MPLPLSLSPSLFVFSLADTLPIKSMLKQSTLPCCKRLNEGGGGGLSEGGNSHCAAAGHARLHACTHTPDGTGRRIK